MEGISEVTTEDIIADIMEEDTDMPTIQEAETQTPMPHVAADLITIQNIVQDQGILLPIVEADKDIQTKEEYLQIREAEPGLLVTITTIILVRDLL